MSSALYRTHIKHFAYSVYSARPSVVNCRVCRCKFLNKFCVFCHSMAMFACFQFHDVLRFLCILRDLLLCIVVFVVAKHLSSSASSALSARAFLYHVVYVVAKIMSQLSLQQSPSLMTITTQNVNLKSPNVSEPENNSITFTKQFRLNWSVI